MAAQAKSPDEWAAVASGLLVCAVTIVIAYGLARVWPRQHYPRFFGTLAGVSVVAALYVLEVPGAGFGLIALAVVAYFSMHVPEAWEGIFASEPKANSPERLRPNPSMGALGFFLMGTLLGVAMAGMLVALLVLPPAYWKKWFFHEDQVNERIARALNPGEEWVAIKARERAASETLRRIQPELASASKRAADSEAALEKARDELGALAPNTVRAIKLAGKSGSRHANGLVYIGVDFPYSRESSCWVTLSSDKVETQKQSLAVGAAASIVTSKGKYRVVLTSVDASTCTFDLVKD